jgi:hypothetical protein
VPAAANEPATGTPARNASVNREITLYEDEFSDVSSSDSSATVERLKVALLPLVNRVAEFDPVLADEMRQVING